MSARLSVPDIPRNSRDPGKTLHETSRSFGETIARMEVVKFESVANRNDALKVRNELVKAVRCRGNTDANLPRRTSDNQCGWEHWIRLYGSPGGRGLQTRFVKGGLRL